jgi:hypothetical protein
MGPLKRGNSTEGLAVSFTFVKNKPPFFKIGDGLAMNRVDHRIFSFVE